jgi:hypothetical protein
MLKQDTETATAIYIGFIIFCLIMVLRAAEYMLQH